MPFEIIFLELPTRTHAATRGLVYFCDSHEGMRMNKACFRDSAPCSGSKKGKTLQADKSLTGFYSTVLSAR